MIAFKNFIALFRFLGLGTKRKCLLCLCFMVNSPREKKISIAKRDSNSELSCRAMGTDLNCEWYGRMVSLDWTKNFDCPWCLQTNYCGLVSPHSDLSRKPFQICLPEICLKIGIAALVNADMFLLEHLDWGTRDRWVNGDSLPFSWLGGTWEGKSERYSSNCWPMGQLETRLHWTKLLPVPRVDGCCIGTKTLVYGTGINLSDRHNEMPL